MAVSPCSYDKWQAVVAGVFVTGALYRLAAGSHEQLGRSHSFIGAFYITCAGLLFRPAFLLYMPLIIGLILMSEVTLKNFLAFLGGIVVPFILLAAGFWFAGYDIGLYMERTLKELTLRNVTFGLQTFSLTQWVSLMVFVLLLLLSVIVRGIRRDSSGSLNKTRFYHAMFWFLLFTAAGLFIWPGHARGIYGAVSDSGFVFYNVVVFGNKTFGRKVWLALFILASVVYFVTNLGVLPSGFKKATILSFSLSVSLMFLVVSHGRNSNSQIIGNGVVKIRIRKFYIPKAGYFEPVHIQGVTRYLIMAHIFQSESSRLGKKNWLYLHIPWTYRLQLRRYDKWHSRIS